MKSVHSSRSTRASQSPNKVEKQPKSTPDMYNPPTRITRARTSLFNTYPRGHSSLLSGLYSLECCEDSVESQTTSINVFLLCYTMFRFRANCKARNITAAKVRRKKEINKGKSKIPIKIRTKHIFKYNFLHFLYKRLRESSL